MFYIQLKTLYYILLLVCFEPSISNKIREDANYKQEFVRIYDQSLSAIIVIDGDIDDGVAPSCSLMKSIVVSLDNIKISNISISMIWSSSRSKNRSRSKVGKVLGDTDVDTVLSKMKTNTTTLNQTRHCIEGLKTLKGIQNLNIQNMSVSDDDTEKGMDKNHYDILVSVSSGFYAPSNIAMIGRMFSLHIYAPVKNKVSTFSNPNTFYLDRHNHHHHHSKLMLKGYNTLVHFADSLQVLKETRNGLQKYLSEFHMHLINKPFHNNHNTKSPTTLPILCTEVVLGLGADDLSEQISDLIIDGILQEPFNTFVKWNLPTLRKKMIASTDIDTDSDILSNSIRSKRTFSNVAIIVEPRVHPHLEFVVRNVILHLGEMWRIEVHVTKINEAFVRKALHGIPNLKLVLIVSNFTNSGDYNMLLKDNTFWKKLSLEGAKHVLIFQVDSILVGNDVSSFLHYDFIGAPWDISKDSPSSEWIRKEMVKTNSNLKSACCNGGLSLRNVDSMVKITAARRSRNPSVNEDMYFSRNANDYALVLPTRTEASKFAQEIVCVDLPQLKPFGLHNTWAYLDVEVVVQLFRESMTAINEEYIEKVGGLGSSSKN